MGAMRTEIRQITCEAPILPATHGSALFTRGQTQALGVVTLGTVGDAQMIDTMLGTWDKHFLLQYNFPPFSVGEAKADARPRPPRDRARSPGRARPDPRYPRKRRIPLHDPHGLRDPGIQRLQLDGDGLRRVAGPDGCGRADQAAGGGDRHGLGGQ